MFRFLGFAAFMLAMSTMPSFAYPLSAEDAANLLRQYGAEDVEVFDLDNDVHVIDAKKNTYNFSVRMMDCSDEGRCRSVMMFSNFNMAGAPDIDQYNRINHFNDSRPFGRAFLLGQPYEEDYKVGVDYVIDISQENNFNAADLDLFFIVVDSFVEHMTAESEY